MPKIPYRDKQLIAGISHYIDYLEKKFHLKTIKKENTENWFEENIENESEAIDALQKVGNLKYALEEKFIKPKAEKLGLKINETRIDLGISFKKNEDKEDNKESNILIYKDATNGNKYSLGWTEGYLSLDPEGVNIYGRPHIWCDTLDELFKKLEEGLQSK